MLRDKGYEDEVKLLREPDDGAVSFVKDTYLGMYLGIFLACLNQCRPLITTHYEVQAAPNKTS